MADRVLERRWQSLFGRGGWVMRRTADCSRSCGGKHGSIRVRRAMIHHGVVGDAGAGDRADEGTVRDVVHAFNETGLAALDPQQAEGRPPLVSSDDDDFIIATLSTRPGSSWANRGQAGPAARDLPPHGWHPLLPRLLLP